MRAENNALVLTASDTDMGIEATIEAEVIEEGSVAVDARMFSEIVKKIPGDTVTVASNDAFATTIRSGKSKFDIGGRNPVDFPALPSVMYEQMVTLAQPVLKSVILDTIFCISSDDKNKMMTGELFEFADGYLRVIALDGHRIAIRREKIDADVDNSKVVVPGKVLRDVSRILSDDAEDVVTIAFSMNHIIFTMPGIKVLSRLIDGEYFKVDQMMNRDYAVRVKVNRSDFIGCVDRATLFVREGDKKPIILDIADAMYLSISSQFGSMSEELTISKEGDDIAIGFNPRFMVDALRAVGDDEVSLYMINSKSPCIIKDEQGSYLYLILPVNFVRSL